MKLPPDMGWTSQNGRRGFAREAARDWLAQALRDHVSIWSAAQAGGPMETLFGRAPLLVFEGGGGEPWVVRRYWRGGAMAWLADRHVRLGTPRPVLEARASEALLAAGVRTPSVMAGGIYPAGIFYRADLVTAYVPDTTDLATLLFAPPEPWRSDVAMRMGALADVGAEVRRLALAGGHHPDLNARNLLVQRLDGQPRPLIVDLDRCTVGSGPTDPAPMLARLERSIRKLAEGIQLAFPAEAWSVVARSARGALPS